MAEKHSRPKLRSESVDDESASSLTAALQEEADSQSRKDELRKTVVRRLVGWSGRREPLVGEITEWLATEIIFGDLSPGSSLDSVNLARRFNVSRTPVREALMLLEHEGLVEIRARRRPWVSAPSPREIREIYNLRAQLLAIMVRELEAKVTNEQIDELRSCVELVRASVKAADPDGYFFRHVEFQDRMMEFTGNSTLKRVIDSLALRTLVLRHVSATSPGRMEVGAHEQEQLVNAIASHDADLAAAIISHSTHQALLTVERAWRARLIAVEETTWSQPLRG